MVQILVATMIRSIDVAPTTHVEEEAFEVLKATPAEHLVHRGLLFWILLITITLCSGFSVGVAELSVDILREEKIRFDLGSGSTQPNTQFGGPCLINMTYRSAATEFVSDIAKVPARAWTSPSGKCEQSPAPQFTATMVFKQGPTAIVPAHLQSLFDGNNLIDDSLVSRSFDIRCGALHTDVTYDVKHAILLKPSKDTSVLDGPSFEKGQLYLILSRDQTLDRGYCIYKRVSSGSSSPTPEDDGNNNGGGGDKNDDKDNDDKGGLSKGELAGIIVSSLSAVVGFIALWKFGPVAAEKLKRRVSNDQPISNEKNGDSEHVEQQRADDRVPHPIGARIIKLLNFRLIFRRS